jgi:hypothetical protein
MMNIREARDVPTPGQASRYANTRKTCAADANPRNIGASPREWVVVSCGE